MTSRDTDEHLYVIDYLRSMLRQLERMASRENQDMLACLIEMAYVEATDISRGVTPRRRGRPSVNRAEQRDSAA